MRERIARAMADSDNQARIGRPVGQRFYRLADAVLDAMREPTEAQIRAIDAACREHWPNGRKMAVAMQQAMVDAAGEGAGL